jgi:dihydropteroate synthase
LAIKNFEGGNKIIKAGKHVLDLSRRTHLMGILNVTPDSFSDGGKYLDSQRAVAHAMRMAEEGADIIDVGGESSRPGSLPVSTEEELRRVLPVVEGLAGKIDLPISIDTYKSEVAERALQAGAVMINDISACRMDQRMVEVAAKYQCPVVLMHMKGTPRDMQLNPYYDSVVEEIYQFFLERVEYLGHMGILRENMIIDPGIGFGKTVEHNLTILRNLSSFRSLGLPILIGTSRKFFIGAVLSAGVEERLEGTAATVALAISQGADIVRVHDVREMKKVAVITDAIVRGYDEKR